MSSSRDPTDTSAFSHLVNDDGSIPSIRVFALVSSAIASVLWGWYSGVIEAIGSVGDWISFGIETPTRWFTSTFIDLPVSVLEDMMAASFEANAEFIAIFGPFAQPVAIAEIGLLIWVMISVLERLLGGGS